MIRKTLGLYFIAFLVLFSGKAIGITQGTLLKLRAILEENPFLGWMHRNEYGSLESLGINHRAVNNSIHSPQHIPTRMKSLIKKALRGEDIEVGVLGGSISAGATLYKSKQETKIYYFALLHWWNNVVGTITKSKMRIRNHAIGATGSDFYAYCLENYINATAIDLVLWELSANDYHRFDNRDVPPVMPLELLLRNILRLQAETAIIGINFFRGKDYIKEGECNNLEGDGANYVLSYYMAPSISWKKLICRKLLSEGKRAFRQLFARDDSHPSVLGHAQVGYLLIEYFRLLLIQLVDQLLSPKDATTIPEEIVNIKKEGILPVPRPIFTKSALVAQVPICFTFNVASDGSVPTNQMTLRVLRNDGYTVSIAHGFLVRKDKTKGLRTKVRGHALHIAVTVPPQRSPGLTDWMILVGTYSNFGGALFFLDGKFSRVIETHKYAYGSIIAAVATHVQPGEHVLVIKSLKRGFFLSSIMLG